MLAQNFKTAAELDLSEEQRGALIKTLALMDAGKLIHVPRYEYDFAGKHSEFTHHFNMGDWSIRADCGTICCIGGAAEHVGNVKFGGKQFDDGALGNLFYPHTIEEVDWAKITVAQAAMALRSYLTTGDARWDLALAEDAPADQRKFQTASAVGS